MHNKKPEYVSLLIDNFISMFGTNVDFLDDKVLIEEYINLHIKLKYEKTLLTIYDACLKAKNHGYPIKDWYDFVDGGFHEVTPDTMHDTHTAEGCYNWFCDMVKLFADILFEHGIITEEEKAQAYVETKLEH